MRKQPNLSEILKIINGNHQCVFIQDVYQYLGVASSTFYRWFPTDSPDRTEIDEALDLNRIHMKQTIRDRLLESKSPSALIALYKLIGTREERFILSSYQNNGTEVSVSKGKDDSIDLVIN